MIWDLYPKALDCGISIELFWNSSILEVRDLMDSCNRIRKEELKRQVSKDFVSVEVLWRWMNNFFKEKGAEFDNPHPWEYYPHLFENEREYSEEEKESMELERVKENRRKYAAEYKKRRGLD